MTGKLPQSPRAPILSLCWSDIKHEWMLNVILMVSIASIIAPLLILLGLKFGLIKYWTDTLIQDPINRQITPKSLDASKQLTDAWFQEIALREDIQFVVPMIRAASSNVGIQPGGKGKTYLLDIIPTKQGDALLLENGATIPVEGEGVITKGVADRFGIVEGQYLEVKLTRKISNKHEFVVQKIKIISVLSSRAGSLQRLYVPAQLVFDIERYKDGGTVPGRGWQRASTLPRFVMDGIYIVMPTSLEDQDLSGLVIRTGFTTISDVGVAMFNHLYHAHVDEKMHVYKLSVQETPTGMHSYWQVKRKLRGKSAVLVPYVEALFLLERNSKKVPFIALSLNDEHAAYLGIPVLPWGKLSEERSFADIGVGLFTTFSEPVEPIEFSVTLNKDNAIVLPIRPVGVSGQEKMVIPFELAGILRTGNAINIVYDKQSNTLQKSASNFYGFRMYAKTIGDVLKIEDDLKQEGIYTNTAAKSISRIKVIDNGLSKMFWLIAIVGVVGGLASMAGSFFVSVRRKTKDLGILRLIGVPSSQIFRFPLYQALIVSFAGVLLATAIYGMLAEVINRVFSEDLPLGQNLCLLPISYLFIAGLVTIAISLMSSLLAAFQTTKIDPSEAIRED